MTQAKMIAFDQVRCHDEVFQQEKGSNKLQSGKARR